MNPTVGRIVHSPMGYVCMSSACPCGMGPVMS